MDEMELTIRMSVDGRVSVIGPVINNKPLAYGMLEGARDAIQEHHAKHQGKIIAPDGPVPPYTSPGAR